MLPYFLKCRKSKESKNPEVKETKNGKITLLLTLVFCTVFGSKVTFNKEEEASGLLSSLGIRTPFSKLPIVGYILF